MTDFRDQVVKEALDETVRSYRPETTRRSRIARILAIAALTLAAFLGFWTLLYYSSPQHANPAPARKAIPVQLVPPAERR